MKKEELLKQLYSKKEQKKDKNYLFLERTKVYFLIDLVKQGLLPTSQASEILARYWTLEEFIDLVRPRVSEIDQLLMEKLLEKF